VSRRVGDWAKTVRLTRTDERFAEFGDDVTKTLHACIEAHIAEQRFPKFTRIADLRRYLRNKAREERDLAKRLRGYTSKYVVGHPTLILPSLGLEPLPGRVFDPTAMAQDLDRVASLTEDAAAACKDKGGPPPMRAFTVLAEGLIHTYRRATKLRGTGRSAREGKLLDLVEAVLPIARRIAMDVTGKPLAVPRDVGDYLHRVAGRL
jgi:hypothetical protein